MKSYIRKVLTDMRRILIPVLLASLMLAVPALARGERVGERISAYGGDITFPANEPFHVAHGWAFLPPDDVPQGGHFDFQLNIDGENVPVDFVERSAQSGGGFAWFWVFNFPDGMTGTHVFTFHWFSSCRYAVNMGLIPGPCANGSEQVESGTQSITVYFE